MSTRRYLRVANAIEEARIGGPQQRIIAVGQALLEHDIETIVVTTPKHSSDFASQAKQAGLTLETINVTRLRQNVLAMLVYAATFVPDVLRYRRLWRRLKPDVVHTNGAPQWKPTIAAGLCGIPLVWHLNDTRCPAYVRPFFTLFSKRWASGFLVSSERSRDVYVPHDTGKPVVLARPPVHLDRYTPREPRNDAERELVVTTVGNLNPDKDILTFIRLAQRAFEEVGNKIVFKVAGRRLDTQPDYNSRIDTAVAEKPANLEFLGFQNDIPGLLAQTDIFVCTSRSEAGPMSVFEAFAAALPVVSTNVGDLKELSDTHGDVAKIAPIGDVDALWAHIQSIIGNREFRQLGQAGRRLAESSLQTANCVDGHIEIYQLVLNHGTK